MRSGMRLLAMTNVANRSREGGDYGRSEMRYGGEAYEPARAGYDGPGMNYSGVESRFRDRQGRERYDDGRYAPMRSALGGMDEPEGRVRRDMPRGYEDMRRRTPEARTGGMRNGGDARMMAGFSVNGGWRDNEAGYEGMDELERRSGSMSHGGARSGAVRPFDREMAEEWTEGMENEDGTKGPHWTIEQAKQVMAQRNISMEPYEFWAALNAMYSDYGKVFKKHGVGDKIDLYVDMAKAFIEDKDAQPEKLSRYFEYVVKH